MGTLFSANERNYWDYYLELESEFYQIKKYVQFDKDNYKTFSIEFLKLLQAICSEIDVLGKYIAVLLNPGFKKKNKPTIRDWWFEIQDNLQVYESVSDCVDPSKKPTNVCDVSLKNYVIDEDFSPWSNYKLEKSNDKMGRTRIKLQADCKAPSWWTAYTDVKHLRTQKDDSGELNFAKANLENVSNAICALYILEISLLELSVDGRKAEAQRFINRSLLFVKTTNAADEDIDAMFENNQTNEKSSV